MKNLPFHILGTFWMVIGMFITDNAWIYSIHHKLPKMIGIKKALKISILRLKRKDWLNYDFERNIT